MGHASSSKHSRGRTAKTSRKHITIGGGSVDTMLNTTWPKQGMLCKLDLTLNNCLSNIKANVIDLSKRR